MFTIKRDNDKHENKKVKKVIYKIPYTLYCLTFLRGSMYVDLRLIYIYIYSLL